MVARCAQATKCWLLNLIWVVARAEVVNWHLKDTFLTEDFVRIEIWLGIPHKVIVNLSWLEWRFILSLAERCALGYVSEKEYVLSRLTLISRCDLFILKPWLDTSLYVGSTHSYPSSQAGEPREESSCQGWSRKWKVEARDGRADDCYQNDS